MGFFLKPKTFVPDSMWTPLYVYMYTCT